MSDSWNPSYEEFQNLFSNNYTLRILVSLTQLKNMRGSASDIASILDIHISTTKKYLDILNKFRLLEKEFEPTKQGKPTYYILKKKKVNISLDLIKMSRNFQKKISIKDILIRERKGIYPQVSFILTYRGSIQAIKIRKKTKAHRFRTHKIELSSVESRFMQFLPHPTMEPEHFFKICAKSQITDYVSLKIVNNFVQKLLKLEIIKEFSKAELDSKSN